MTYQHPRPRHEHVKDLVVYPACFVGAEAVEWLRHWLHTQGLPCAKEDAEQVGTRLIRASMPTQPRVTH